MKIDTKRRYVDIEMRIDGETLAALRLIAKRERISLNNLISDCIHRFLLEEQQ